MKVKPPKKKPKSVRPLRRTSRSLATGGGQASSPVAAGAGQASRPVATGGGQASRLVVAGSRRTIILHETLRGGQAWSRRLSRGQILRIVDPTGTACVSALCYNARDPVERYNLADTLKAQYTAFLTVGRVLYSDMGRVLMSIIGDTCGWHDTLSGCGDASSNQARFGPGRYQELRNEFHRNARDNFIVELSKVGLGKRDIVACVNFFARVSADDAGRIRWIPGNSRPSAYVDLRSEMETFVVLSNTPHPLDTSRTYAPPAVEISVRWSAPSERPGPRDLCRLSRPENGRGFALTEAYVREMESVSGTGREAAP